MAFPAPYPIWPVLGRSLSVQASPGWEQLGEIRGGQPGVVWELGVGGWSVWMGTRIGMNNSVEGPQQWLGSCGCV